MKLTHLNLSFSSFYGVIPTEIFHLSKLVSLDLSGVTYSLRLPKLSQHVFNKHSQNLTKLRYLHLDEVDLSSVAPGSSLNLSSTLISLSVGDTGLQGRFPNDVFRLPFLQKLSLTTNIQLRGNLPNSNWSSSLRFLDLSLTNFSGQLPDAVSDLRCLNVLDLSFTSFSGKLPDKIGNLRYLNVLDLSMTYFTSSIPTSLRNCTNITSLDLAAFNLPQLSALDFSENQFEGLIPYQVSGLSNLLSLDLCDNFLDGRVPSWLFTLPSSASLDLSNNKLTGPIEEFHQPGSVTFVSLLNNQIQGSILNSMFELLNLTDLDLSFNNLSGIVKPETCPSSKI
ncbi:receptor-like protein 9DC3 [Pistacia vera]|uniref:receptor-like protein 9DC3 n=1 Tax=Pistacia vera TaxID=55513 RepID=UPI001262C360|nr:receptor-like protein 9DC3 [Pistacia vera]